MLCLLNEEFLMRKNNLQREKLKLEVEKLFFLLQVHFPPLEYAKFTARKTRHEVDKGLKTLSCTALAQEPFKTGRFFLPPL